MTDKVDFRASRTTFDVTAQKWRPVILEMIGPRVVTWEPMEYLADTAEEAHAIADQARRT